MLVIAESLSDDVWWLSSRAFGTAALLFSSAAISIALIYKLIGERERAIWLGALHEVLGLATVVCVLLHGFVLLNDSFLNPSFKDIAVPFAEPYMRTAFGIGVIAGYLTIAFALVYYLRRQIGRRRFRVLHRITVLAWLAVLMHTAMMGTDSSTAWYLIVVLPFIVTVPVALGMRLGLKLQEDEEMAPAAAAPSE